VTAGMLCQKLFFCASGSARQQPKYPGKETETTLHKNHTTDEVVFSTNWTRFSYDNLGICGKSNFRLFSLILTSRIDFSSLRHTRNRRGKAKN